MSLLWSLILNTIAVLITSYLVNGVSTTDIPSALLLAIVLGLINTFIKPIVKLLTLPINLVTLGLFSLITNTLLLMLAAYFVPGFELGGFINAFIFSLVLSIVSLFTNLFKSKS